MERGYQVGQYYGKYRDAQFEFPPFKKEPYLEVEAKDVLEKIAYQLEIDAEEGSYAYVYKDNIEIKFFIIAGGIPSVA